MKKRIGFLAALVVFIASGLQSCGGGGEAEVALPDSTGLPGDHFSLAGALDLFKNSDDLKQFEKNLNSKKQAVNNLDLNGDEKTDYIRVSDQKSGDHHLITLQVPVSESETQDVAVISVVKTGEKSATVQIVGNRSLYGDSAFVEPETGSGKAEAVVQASLTPGIFRETQVVAEVNVWLWPPVRYIYSPAYVVYVSPVVFNAWPVWYEPWKPYPYGWYRREIAHRHKGYHPVAVLHPGPVRMMYFSGWNNSPMVINRYQMYYVKNGYPKMKGKPYYHPGMMVRPGGHGYPGMKMKPGKGGGPLMKSNGRGGKGMMDMKRSGGPAFKDQGGKSGKGGFSGPDKGGSGKMKSGGHGGGQGGKGGGKK